MICPNCKTKLEKTIFYKVEIDYCPFCLGIFFEEDELRQAKDEKDKELSWVDVDLWEEEEKFKISPSQKLCPKCEIPLYEVEYDVSGIKVDVCNLCHGIWLDRGEFKEIIEYLKKKADYDIENHPLRSFLEEVKEVFIGPESFKEEVLDVLTLIKLLSWRFLAKHPIISKNILNLPK